MKTCCSLAVAGDVLDGVFLCCPFFHEMSWMRSGTKLRQFLRVFLSTLKSQYVSKKIQRNYLNDND